MNKTNFQFNPKSGTMEPVNPIRHELEKSKPEFVKEAPKPQPRLNGAKDMVSEQQVKSNVQDNDQIVKFRVMAERATRNGTVGHYVPLDADRFVEILELAK